MPQSRSFILEIASTVGTDVLAESQLLIMGLTAAAATTAMLCALKGRGFQAL